jgi:selenocysteine-specific elongation factor
VGVIGTAGHVDHGKSTLVHALTGIDPDRLQEEKEREMTIDLGFAWLDLPDGQQVGVVDVPGHKDFIKNMLAGIGGIDAALFIIAADEGVMPQTREHLDILDLLQVEAGIIALTKIDLVHDPEWFDLVTTDIMEQMEGTCLEDAPIIRVSARTGEGLAELKHALANVLENNPPRQDQGRARLPVDRIFTIAGFGTIVTGTLIDGALRVGDEVEIQPSGLKARIRGIQTHRQKLERVLPGHRVAVNVTGVRVDQIKRGDVVASPGVLRSTRLVDASLRYLTSSPVPLKHNMQVDVFAGAAEIPATVRLLDREIAQPGDSCWVQLRLEAPAALRKGDRFIIRLASPSVTIGGGNIVDPHPRRRHRRMRPEIIHKLETLAFGTPVELLVDALHADEPCTWAELAARSTLPDDETATALDEALRNEDILILSATPPTSQNVTLTPGTFLISRGGWATLSSRIEELLVNHHQRFPLRLGMPREELKSRLQLAGKTFNQLATYAEAMGLLKEVNGFVQWPGFRVAFSEKQQEKIDHILAQFRRQPYTPPSIGEISQTLDDELLNACFEQGLLIKLSDEIAYLPETYADMRDRIVAHIQEEGMITIAQVRDLFGTSRRYSLALMGYLDQQGVTRRVGDERVLR